MPILFRIVNFRFAAPANNRMQIKENEKINKYLDLARGLKTKKKKGNMRVTVIPIVVGAPGTVLKGLAKRLEELEIQGGIKTIQTT